DGDGVAVGVGDVEKARGAADSQAAGVQADGDGPRLLPLPADGLEHGDGPVVGDAGARVDADRRFRGGGLRVAVLRWIAAPVTDVGLVGAGELDGEGRHADRDDLDDLARFEVDALDAVAAGGGDPQLLGRAQGHAGRVGGAADLRLLQLDRLGPVER